MDAQRYALNRQPITDWDDAYANGAYIPDSQAYPPKWMQAAQAFRSAAVAAGRAEVDIAYGSNARHRFDLFYPEAPPLGLFVFVHGGYWLRFDKSVWSHLAAGAIARGWAVAMPSYRLAPEATLAEISTDVCAAITAAAQRIPGPIRLAGHSAGGHLVTRAVTAGSNLPEDVLNRIGHVVSISGLHDLRPLMKTSMNDNLRLDEAQALAESPALLPVRGTPAITCWVGGSERPEFLRQNRLLASIWPSLGIETTEVIIPDQHHFSVIEPLEDPRSDLAIRCAP